MTARFKALLCDAFSCRDDLVFLISIYLHCRGAALSGRWDAIVKTPECSTAAAFPRYLTGEVVADSAALQWPGLFARHFRFPRVVDRLLVPATPEPHISCNLRGTAEFHERDVGGTWITRQIRSRDLFVTRSRAPYKARFRSPPGQELEALSIHIAVEPFLAALEARYPGKSGRVEVVDYFGGDEILLHICLTCFEMLAARTPGKSQVFRRVVGVTPTDFRGSR